MDLDSVDMAKVECYSCHAMGHMADKCPKGHKRKPFNNSRNRPNNSDRRRPNLLLMEHLPFFLSDLLSLDSFVSPFQDHELQEETPFITPFSDADGKVYRASQESSESLDGPTEDGQIDLEEYKNHYLEALRDIEPETLLNLNKEREAVARVIKDANDFCCCRSCKAYGNEDSPPTTSSGISYFDLTPQDFNTSKKRTHLDSPKEQEPGCDHDVFSIDMKTENLNPEKKTKLELPVIDGYRYTTIRTPSPSNGPDPVELAERELVNVETWSHILNTTYTSWADRDDFDSVCTPDEENSSTAAVESRGSIMSDAHSNLTDYKDPGPQAINLPSLSSSLHDLSVVDIESSSLSEHNGLTRPILDDNPHLASHEEDGKTSLPIYPV
ncbi:uncharacterized protein MELLADRAFT_87845 [Melampsora larici-populina 98AG31]|uniref:CCHC-type domain-containing protein n=1 Tax=Melampsora larici-populina (strain 98AG31 / pathotype 3-4-7) TaxID=747676 RepID=F4RPP1_MELLP|nr:uncharacterized protein MELLADRAFT_87845 [Melampsora larici-populina 98AG31]EGG05573.1 hypothetical protein MELLADRAFT_87845 [Melampsora larici-populina 98AG31]